MISVLIAHVVHFLSQTSLVMLFFLLHISLSIFTHTFSTDYFVCFCTLPWVFCSLSHTSLNNLFLSEWFPQAYLAECRPTLSLLWFLSSSHRHNTRAAAENIISPNQLSFSLSLRLRICFSDLRTLHFGISRIIDLRIPFSFPAFISRFVLVLLCYRIVF